MAIMNENGDILSTGCNDVPAYGGGLYTSEHGDNDHRCIFKNKNCSNDHRKSILESKFKDVLTTELKAILEDDKSTQSKKVLDHIDILAHKLLSETPAKSLIEYSRAVHAEMDAIVQLARIDGKVTLDSTLYCTTYPCHSCARHIVAAGIKKVIYIEPYEKSLALILHDDSISDSPEENKVLFQPFEGVSPLRYFKFFQAQSRKDKSGKATIRNIHDSNHVDSQQLDDYYDYEDKIVTNFKEKVST